MAYKAVVIQTLLYGANSVGHCMPDKVLNYECYALSNYPVLIKSQMRRVGHVIRMDDDKSKDFSMFIIKNWDKKVSRSNTHIFQ